MPFARKDFAFANFDFQSGTASVESSPIDVKCIDLVTLPPSGLNDIEAGTEMGDMPVDCHFSLHIADIKKDLFPELYRAPIIATQEGPDRRSSNFSTSSSSGTTFLESISEEPKVEEVFYLHDPILIIVSDMDAKDDDNRHSLVQLDQMTLITPFPYRTEDRIRLMDKTKASIYKPKLKCLHFSNRSHCLKVPHIDETCIRYSGRKCRVCIALEIKKIGELRMIAESRRRRIDEGLHQRMVVAKCVRRFLSTVRK